MDQNRSTLTKLLIASQTSLASSIFWGVVIVALAGGLLFAAYRAKLALNPIEYEGRIVDKWAGYSHSDEGSFPYFRLLLETENSQRVTVAVDQDTYDRAKVGMRIRKTQRGIELSRVEPGTVYANLKILAPEIRAYD